MKTGYSQHFEKINKKVNSTPKTPSFNVKPEKNFSTSIPQKKEKKPSFPLLPLFSFIMIAGSGLLFLENFDSIELYLKRIEVGVGTAQAVEVTKEAKEKSESKTADSASQDMTSTSGANTESKALPIEAKKIDDADYLFKLADRKKQLDQREEELNKLAEQIEKQKNEISEKLIKLEETRIKISKTLEEKIKSDDGKVETLVQMYSNMKPAQVAKVFETLDEDLVIEILGRMKKKSAADILNLIKPEKAQIFAERYTGYRVPASK